MENTADQDYRTWKKKVQQELKSRNESSEAPSNEHQNNIIYKPQLIEDLAKDNLNKKQDIEIKIISLMQTNNELKNYKKLHIDK